MDLCRGTDIISEIRKERLQCLGHVATMPEERTVKKAFKIIPEGKGPLEIQERDGWTMLKITRAKRVLEVGGKQREAYMNCRANGGRGGGEE